MTFLQDVFLGTVRRRWPLTLPGMGIWLTAALSIGSACIILLSQVNYGVGVSPDSVAYIGSSRNLLAGDGLFNMNGGIYRDQPPLFPMLLAGPGIFGLDPADTAGYLNAAAFALTVFLSTMWLRKKLRSRFLVGWGCAAIVISPPLVLASSWAWSESTFILLTMLSLFFLDRFLRAGKRSDLFAAAGFTALACLDRYIGGAIVAAAAPLLLIRKDAALRERAKSAAVYCTIALAPLCAWLLRNFLRSGAPFGQYEYSPLNSPLSNLESGFVTFAEWAVGRLVWRYIWFESIPSTEALDIGRSIVGGGLLLAFLILLAGGAGYIIVRSLRRGRRVGTTVILAVFVVVFTCLMTVNASVQGVEPINERLLSPVYLPLLLLGALALDRFFRRGAQRMASKHLGSPLTASRLAIVVMVGMSLWLLPSAVLYADELQERLEYGGGYHSRLWRESETILYLEEHPRAGYIWSNEERPVHILVDDRGSTMYRRLPLDLTDDMRNWGQWRTRDSKFARAPADGKDSYIVWFHDLGRGTYTYNALDLMMFLNVEVEADMSDGVVFRVNEGASASANGLSDLYEPLVSGDPAAHSEFDVYLEEDALSYFKEPCTSSDTSARFFLRLTPSNADDLPDHRRRQGFDSREFEFERRGVVFGQKCYARFVLPQYPIAAVSTGQYSDEGKIWEAEFSLDGR